MSEQPAVPVDKLEQYDQIQTGLMPGEHILAVYDAIGAGTGFIGLTNWRVVIQDKSFVGKKVAITSIPVAGSLVTTLIHVNQRHMGEVRRSR